MSSDNDLLSSDWTAFLANSLDAIVAEGENSKDSARKSGRKLPRKKKASNLNTQAPQPPSERSNEGENSKESARNSGRKLLRKKKASNLSTQAPPPPSERSSEGENSKESTRKSGRKLPRKKKASNLNTQAPQPSESSNEKKKKKIKKKIKKKNEVKQVNETHQKSTNGGDKSLPGFPDFEPSSDINNCASTLGLNRKAPQWEPNVGWSHKKEEVPSSIENISVLNPDSPVYYEDLVNLCNKCEELPTNDEKEGLVNVGIAEPEPLPIDDHEDEILHSISKNRVTIIHGETGCGKSTRIPLMLLNNGGGVSPYNVRMFVSQPRRIAAHGLMERLRSFRGYKDIIGMRLGHGTKDETPLTRVWFVTAGYLVRLLSHHPDAFNNHSHLVIDEVHERSVDGDVLCLLAKRLLNTHPKLRLIVMSATMATDKYEEYFNVSQPSTFVGARHFPIRELYSDDVVHALHLDQKILKQAKELTKGTQCGQELGMTLKKVQYEMTVQITKVVGLPGSSVLVFVSGMSDILELVERFEKLKGDYNYLTLPIHSGIPSDEQMLAFQPAPEKIKVVIATNAAESSVTLPDIDHVICLGQAKLIQYNPGTHRSILTSCWISKASATQRAGRTGRVRPGTVYRLYARELYEQHMIDHDGGEIHRQPLDGVILGLKSMLNQAVVPILQDILEPPKVDFVQRAFVSLYDNDLIDSPDDEGNMTVMGDFVAGMGIDLHLGQIIGLGVQFGCVPEAICMAAVLTTPKLPFRIANPIIHDDPHTFNEIGGRVMLSKEHFDNGLYSEPLMLVRLIAVYNSMDTKRHHAFCMKWSLSHVRFTQLLSTVRALQERVALNLGIHVSSLSLNPRFATSPAKVNILRLLLLWILHENLIMTTIRKKPSKYPFTPYVVNVASEKRINQDELRKSLPIELRSNMSHNSGVRMTYTAKCDTPLSCKDIEKSVKALVFDELEADCSWVSFKVSNSDRFAVPSSHDGWNDAEIEDDQDQSESESSSCFDEGIVLWIRNLQMGLVDDILDSLAHVTCQGKEYVEGYQLSSDSSSQESSVEISSLIEFRALASKSNMRKIKTLLDRVPNAMGVNIFKGQIVVHCIGLNIGAETLPHLFQVKDGVTFSHQTIREKQAIYFPTPLSSEQDQCLLNDIPIGARVLSQLAYGYRDRKMRIWEDERKAEKIALKLGIKPLRWRLAPHTGRSGAAYLQCFSLSAACNPLHHTETNMYAIAGLMLDLQGGAAQAERVTILPLGEKWVSLALLAFGLHVTNVGFKPKNPLPEKTRLDAELLDEKYQAFNKKSDKLKVNMSLIRALNTLFGFEHNPEDYCNP